MSSNLPISAVDLVGAIVKTTNALAADMSGKAYLKLHKGGFFVYGADDMEVEEGSKWAVNPNSFALGYVAWPDEGTGAPLGEEMRSITDDPIVMSALPQTDGKWVQQVGMQLMCVSGEDVGTETVFKASSKGGINGFNDFLNQVLVHLKANTDTDRVVPVVELEVADYKHPKYGKIYTPIFTIKSWSTMDEMPTEDAPEKEPEAETPALENKPEPEPEKKPDPVADAPVAEETPKPKRRRRRKSAA